MRKGRRREFRLVPWRWRLERERLLSRYGSISDDCSLSRRYAVNRLPANRRPLHSGDLSKPVGACKRFNPSSSHSGRVRTLTDAAKRGRQPVPFPILGPGLRTGAKRANRAFGADLPAAHLCSFVMASVTVGRSFQSFSSVLYSGTV